jgi:hypothetical protein
LWHLHPLVWLLALLAKSRVTMRPLSRQHLLHQWRLAQGKFLPSKRFENHPSPRGKWGDFRLKFQIAR